MSKKYALLTFKGICMNFLLELKFFILSHPLTSKQPRKIVQIHMHHPVYYNLIYNNASCQYCVSEAETKSSVSINDYLQIAYV